MTAAIRFDGQAAVVTGAGRGLGAAYARARCPGCGGVDASFHLTQAAVPHMRRQRYGRIVLTTSGRALGIDGTVPGLTAYAAGKMAELGLMNALAVEVGEADIRINAVSPVAATRVLRRSAPELAPELVAPGVVFLASSRCEFSGAVLRAAGGRFSTARVSFTDGVDLGTAPAAPETIAARSGEISGEAT